jgi:hypothetical protein
MAWFFVQTGAANGTAEAAQFDGLTRHPLVAALNKLAEFDYAPLQRAIDHGEAHAAAASYVLICVRDR